MFLLVSIGLTGIANLRHLEFFSFCLYRTYGDRSSLYFFALISEKLTGIAASLAFSLYMELTGIATFRHLVKFSKSSELTGIAARSNFCMVSLYAGVLLLTSLCVG